MPRRRPLPSPPRSAPDRSRPLRSVPRTFSVSEFLLPLVGVLALVAVGITVESILSPFVVAGGVVFLLYPYRDHPLISRSITLALLLLALWTFVSLFAILVPFLLAYVLAYVLDPLITRLTARGIPRWAGSLVVVLLLVGAVVGVALFVLPIVFVQFEGIIRGMSSLVSDITGWLESGTVTETLESFGLPAENVRQMLTSELVPRFESIVKSLLDGILGLLSSITSVALHVINAVIIPFVTFYLLKDFPGIGNRFYRMFPEGRRDGARTFIARIDSLMGRYLRGAVAVAVIQGVLSASVLSLIGVQYALVLGIMTSVLNFIPYVGLVISLVVASLVALFSGEPVVSKVIGVVILYLGQKVLEAAVLSPKIIGPQVGLHPVVLILSLMVFGYFLGFVGMLIAVPATALLLMLWEGWETKRDGGV